MGNENNDRELSRQYDDSVERERAAWQELHSHAPGSGERERAWNAWSDAIMRTNHAWRRLSACRVYSPVQPARVVDSARGDAAN